MQGCFREKHGCFRAMHGCMARNRDVFEQCMDALAQCRDVSAVIRVLNPESMDVLLKCRDVSLKSMPATPPEAVASRSGRATQAADMETLRSSLPAPRNVAIRMFTIASPRPNRSMRCVGSSMPEGSLIACDRSWTPTCLRASSRHRYFLARHPSESWDDSLFRCPLVLLITTLQQDISPSRELQETPIN